MVIDDHIYQVFNVADNLIKSSTPSLITQANMLPSTISSELFEDDPIFPPFNSIKNWQPRPAPPPIPHKNQIIQMLQVYIW